MRWLIMPIMVLASVTPLSAQQPSAARVAVAKVFEKEVAPTTPLVGVVDFDQSAGISSEISGLMVRHRMVEGKVVRKGDLLAQLNTEFLLKDIKVIDQQIAQFDIRIEKAHKNLKRFETLFKQEATSEKEYDDLAFELRELRVEKQTLQVTLAKKKLELDKNAIRAPFDGLVVERFKEIGEWISPDDPICLLAAVGQTVIKVPVSEGLIRYVKSGQAVAVTIDALGREFQGHVRTIAPKVDPKSKTFELKVGIEFVEGLLQNMSASINVPSGHQKKLKMIKRDAIVRFQGKTFVYTVKEEKAEMLPVEVAAVDGEYLGVDAPYITAGMPVVVDGNERLQPGQAVQIVDKPGLESHAESSKK
ncbi:MAG: efflux RND transporter periplasmic adaptor subunit [Desulfobacteraceae bacterium]|jgi:RND family efflux transporter MFP subunit